MHLLSRYLKQKSRPSTKTTSACNTSDASTNFPSRCRKKWNGRAQETSRNTGMVLTLALNYSARSELVDAFHSMRPAAASNGGVEHLKIDEETISQHLYTSHLPDPDLVIRTSGEMRLSNFLLWQLAYAEIYVTPTLWPEFRGTHLLEGIADYQKRDRRYGGLNEDHPTFSRADLTHCVALIEDLTTQQTPPLVTLCHRVQRTPRCLDFISRPSRS